MIRSLSGAIMNYRDIIHQRNIKMWKRYKIYCDVSQFEALIGADF